MPFDLSNISFPSPSKIVDEVSSQVKNVASKIGDTASSVSNKVSSLFDAPAKAVESGVKSLLPGEMAVALGTIGSKNVFQSQLATNSLMSQGQSTNTFTATLTSKQTGATIWFNVTPNVDESRSAYYDAIQPIHHPGTIQVYRSSEARTFSVSAKLIARTAAEASTNLAYLNLIRSWVMPYFGKGTAKSADANRLGAPPDILIFDVYGSRNISKIPCVLNSYHWAYPDNVDYIPTTDGQPVPTVMDISLSLTESYAPEQFTKFDIVKYRAGDMSGAFGSNPPAIAMQSYGSPMSMEDATEALNNMAPPAEEWKDPMADFQST